MAEAEDEVEVLAEGMPRGESALERKRKSSHQLLPPESRQKKMRTDAVSKEEVRLAVLRQSAAKSPGNLLRPSDFTGSAYPHFEVKKITRKDGTDFDLALLIF